MQYVLLISRKPDDYAELSDEERQATSAAY